MIRCSEPWHRNYIHKTTETTGEIGRGNRKAILFPESIVPWFGCTIVDSVWHKRLYSIRDKQISKLMYKKPRKLLVPVKYAKINRCTFVLFKGYYLYTSLCVWKSCLNLMVSEVTCRYIVLRYKNSSFTILNDIEKEAQMIAQLGKHLTQNTVHFDKIKAILWSKNVIMWPAFTSLCKSGDIIAEKHKFSKVAPESSLNGLDNREQFPLLDSFQLFSSGWGI